MARSYPSVYTARSSLTYRTGRDVNAADWRELSQHLDVAFKNHVAEMGGHAFEPAATTTDSSFNAFSDSSSRDANELNFGGTIDRIAEQSTVRFLWSTYGFDGMEVKATILNVDGAAVTVDVTNSHGGDPAWIHNIVTLSHSDILDGSGNPGFLDVTVQWRAGGAADKASLLACRIGGDYQIPTNQLPTADAT